MLYEVEGDIMLSRAPVIALGVASHDAMSRGLARKLAERYPALLQDFKQWCEGSHPKPGQIWLWGARGKGQVICMLTHQGDAEHRRAGRPEKIAVNQTLRALRQLSARERFKAIAMPAVGAGKFALDWFDVRGMMHAQLGDLLFPVFIYHKQLDGQLAHEPGM